MAKRRRSSTGEVRTVHIPAAHYQNLPPEKILAILTQGEIQLEGVMPWSSNYTFLVQVAQGDLQLLAIYKPCKGERPLWDFPHGSLCKREYAAFLVSEALGWSLVPVTILRDGPHGPGSVQLFIDCDPGQHYFTLKDEHPDVFKRVAVFDALLNNTDRKGGHCLIDHQGKIWAIDHGVTFHCEPKLRTVIWDYAGQAIPDALLNDLRRVQRQICGDEPVAQQLRQLIDRPEMEAFLGRLNELIQAGTFPEPNSDWYTIPWPPV
jgi:uncharacterized repeat protein (TIGR03843 family)